VLASKNVNIFWRLHWGRKIRFQRPFNLALVQCLGASFTEQHCHRVAGRSLSGGALEFQGATRVNASTIPSWCQEGSFRQGGKIERIQAAGNQAKRQD
jgi:hypothetical protein